MQSRLKQWMIHLWFQNLHQHLSHHPPSVFIDQLETVHNMNKSGSTNVGVSMAVFDFDYMCPLHGFGKHAPTFPTETNNKEKDQSPYKEGLRSSTRRDPIDKSSFRFPKTQSEKAHVEDFQDSQELSLTCHLSLKLLVGLLIKLFLHLHILRQVLKNLNKSNHLMIYGLPYQRYLYSHKLKNETLARSADAIVAYRALVNLLEDQPSEEMKVVAICAL
ncbi:unnamed protein product [Lactuca saligna]|uniref:Uncharacterized protein n=1 Tax=Lactuca saligna TaxID=75948 RepID=A0AA35VGI7_LACSI|nr:unnamed protein product [Lactuca saligna]